MTDGILLALWGKTDEQRPNRAHPLLCHLLDSAAVAEALLPRFGPIGGLPPEWVLYLVAMHDIGKADPRFQQKAEFEHPRLVARLRELGLPFPLQPQPGFRHEAVSADWLMTHLRQAHGWGASACRIVAAAIRGHHANFGAEEPHDDEPRRSAWETLRGRLAATVDRALGLRPSASPEFVCASDTGLRLVGLVVLSDWIASNDEIYPFWELYSGPEAFDAAGYLESASRTARKSVASLRLDLAPAQASVSAQFKQVWPGITELRPAQEVLDEESRRGIPPGLVVIEAPMGEGKTEAAIFLADHWERTAGRSGAYLALPTMATSNQMHRRYRSFLPREADARLIHGMAWLMEDDAPAGAPQTDGDTDEAENARDWFRNVKRAIIAPYGVGTVDQAMRGALNVKHGFLRLFGLSPRTLVIDEVHAYDEYMTVIIERLLSCCRTLGIPVVLLSATLAWEQKRRLAAAYAPECALPAPRGNEEPYPLITIVSPGQEPRLVPTRRPSAHREICVERHYGLLANPEATAHLAVAQVRNGGCACVLANTVKDAQAIFDYLRREAEPGICLRLFHARFRAERRQHIEDEVVSLFGKDAGDKRPAKAIVVATQVVEQSLDLDFDVLLSQIAPIDLLLQRCGRMHRHLDVRPAGHRPTGERAVLHLLLPPAGEHVFGPTEKVYHRAILLKTLAILHGRPVISLPAQFRCLIESCYGNGAIPGVIPAEIIEAAQAEYESDKVTAAGIAGTHLIPEPSAEEFTLANTGPPVPDNEDDPRVSWFNARTRRVDDGHETIPVLLLDDEELIQAARQPRPPRRDLLKRLFLQRAEIPGYWIPGEERAALAGPRWLRSHLIVPLDSGCWRSGSGMGLRDDPVMGIARLETA